MTEAPDLAGQRALVTGGAVRVGRAISRALADSGMHVAVHYNHSADAAHTLCDEIRGAGGQAHAFAADLSDRSAARQLVSRAATALGGLDLVVLSAASFERVPFEQVDDAAWDRTLALNLTGTFAVAQEAAKPLAQSQGSMVFITCSSAITPFRNYLPYVVSKGAVRQLMRTLALELAPAVRVNAVAPGTVLPPENMAPDALARIVKRIPLGRAGDADGIARAVVYLAGATFVTGQEIAVDGGRSLAAVERFS